jgi:hypothetical protein
MALHLEITVSAPPVKNGRDSRFPDRGNRCCSAAFGMENRLRLAAPTFYSMVIATQYEIAVLSFVYSCSGGTRGKGETR